MARTPRTDTGLDRARSAHVTRVDAAAHRLADEWRDVLDRLADA